MDTVFHEIEPIFNRDSKILILGSFPSVKSREGHFFYNHPQNRFWKVLAKIFNCEVPQTIEEKKQFLLNNQIAVWDVIASCEIKGSSDSSIKHVVPNDLNRILSVSHIEQIYTNGNAAFQLYEKYCKSQTHMDAIKTAIHKSRKRSLFTGETCRDLEKHHPIYCTQKVGSAFNASTYFSL